MRLQFDQIIEVQGDLLFTFHENPQHLVLLHRGWSAFRLIAHDGNLHTGSRLWFETTVAGILPVVLGFEHHVYEPPHRFGEQLIHGPFSRFTHIHEFVEVDSGTAVRDALEVELPWYYGGELAMKILVAPWLRRVFKFRGAALQQLAQSGEIRHLTEQLA